MSPNHITGSFSDPAGRWVVTCVAVVITLVSAGTARASGGQTLWRSRFNSQGGLGADFAYQAAVSPDARTVFVTGSGSLGMATVAYDAETGTERWRAETNQVIGEGDSIAVSPDGSRVFVAGHTLDPGTQEDFAAAAYDATSGDMLWITRYDGPGNGPDYARSVAVSPDGSRVFATGYVIRADGRYLYQTIAYDAATGDRIWSARYGGPKNGESYARAIAASRDGTKVFVTGLSAGNDFYSDYATVAYDSTTGSPLWVRRYDGPGHAEDQAFAMAMSPDGSQVFVTGESTGASTRLDYATVAYDAINGSERWVGRYDGPVHSQDQAWSVTASPDGARLYVTGWSLGQFDYDIATIAYDAAAGATLWGRRYNGPGNGSDGGYSIAAAPDGTKVFVTGQSTGAGTSADYATVAYDTSTGATSWSKRYNGPGNDVDSAFAVAVSPDGSRVFVTGWSKGIETDYDFETIAYLA